MIGRKDIPDTLSVTNGTLGVFAIMYAIDGAYAISCGLILVAILMDGLDGAAARRLNAVSSRGKELDSIADMISFTMAPAVLIYSWHYDPAAGSSLLVLTGFTTGRAINLLTVITSATGMLLGMYRLLRYRSTDFDLPYFRGVPTPAYAFLVVTAIHILPPAAFLLLAASIGLLMVVQVDYPRLGGLLAVPALVGLALAMAGTALPDLRVHLLVPALALIFVYIGSPLLVRKGPPPQGSRPSEGRGRGGGRRKAH